MKRSSYLLAMAAMMSVTLPNVFAPAEKPPTKLVTQYDLERLHRARLKRERKANR